jgi:two-component system, NarL family, nitrate/nitrite response regulator NarL
MSRHSAERDALSATSAETDHGSMLGARILIVSDVRLYREALASRFGQNDRLAIVGAVERQDALREAGRLQPDLVLLDMGEWNGLDLANALLQQHPALGILAIAVPERVGSAIAAIGGIAGFVPRDGSMEDVIAEVDRLTAGRGEPVTLAPAAVEQKAAKAVAAARSRAGELTVRECEILELIEFGLSNKEIARKLRIEVGTVKNHVHNILEKLNVRRRNQAAHRVRVRVWSDNGDA